MAAPPAATPAMDTSSGGLGGSSLGNTAALGAGAVVGLVMATSVVADKLKAGACAEEGAPDRSGHVVPGWTKWKYADKAAALDRQLQFLLEKYKAMLDEVRKSLCCCVP